MFRVYEAVSMPTELCDLARKWGTDKVLYYTSFYHQLFKDRRDIKKVLELGIGHPGTMLDSVCRMNQDWYVTGASLFMWEEYFPNADIFALDNKRDIFIEKGRIKSFYVDQEDAETFAALPVLIGKNFDLIIEDGWHTRDCQLRSALNLLPLLADDGIYVIEDVGAWHADLISKIPYHCELAVFGPARLIVIRK